MGDYKVDKIKKIGKRAKPQGLQAEPNKDYFQALMDQKRVQTDTTAQQIEAGRKSPSLMDEVANLNQRVDRVNEGTPREIAKQAEDLVAQIDEIKTKLKNSDVEIKGPVQTLLKRKLSHIDENLQVALSKAGLEYTPADPPADFQKPIKRFLRFLTHGQDQLSNLATNIQDMHVKEGGIIQPSDMLLIQIKVNYIQQEIELFTSMLNKALESTKTIMNVQV